MTPETGPCTWPVPSPADTARALEGIGGDIARGLPPKPGDALIVLAAIRADAAPDPAPDPDPDPDPDQPIPFALTAKAHAALTHDGTPVPAPARSRTRP